MLFPYLPCLDDSFWVGAFGRVSRVISGVVYASDILEKSDDSAGNQNPHGGVRLHWKPDIDFLDPKKLIRPTKSAKEFIPALQKLVLLCSIEAQKRLSRLSTTVPHLRKFKSWLNAQVEKAEASGYLFVEDSKKLIALSSIDRIALIEAIVMEIKSPVSVAVKRIFEAIEGIFKGEIDPLDLLMQDGALTKFYDSASDWNYRDFVGMLSHSKPHLRILEIGAGTGGTTAVILKGLVSTYGEPMFSSYTFTDISPGFFMAAKERFASAPNMEFSVLDINQDPADQGFQLGSYDLVIAANASISATNKNTKVDIFIGSSCYSESCEDAV
ncbi:hypothetical protein BGAL_0036g00330 [Botrytis galanthina]|uniref:Methyltransferase type 12 domain-containing protein n=1 Tax=Botrytis galanthina TaxID=278940 RepID=A0A4S8RK47_9HELO|nr:hypothetical protein BGAL_0036g00330 [Botrytis galanthina]